MLWDLLFCQKLCKPVPITSEIQGDGKMKRTIFQPQMATSKEIVHRKLIGTAMTLELENTEKSLCKAKYKWEHKRKKLVQNEEEKM
jgi:uncharacterized metal-binding protein